MKALRALGVRVEPLLLAGVAGFMLYLVFLGDYWMYFNPRFRWVTAAGGVALAGLGLRGLVRPPAGTGWPRVGLWALLLALCLFSEHGVQQTLDSMGLDREAMRQADEPAPPSRFTQGGREYVRINLGELFDLATNGPVRADGPGWAVRGFVLRTPELDAQGRFLLYRVAMYCCLADTTAVGFRVEVPKGTRLPENGQWVVVTGSLANIGTGNQTPEPAISGAAFTSVQPDYLLKADRLEKQKPPGTGLMYEWRREEPYAY